MEDLIAISIHLGRIAVVPPVPLVGLVSAVRGRGGRLGGGKFGQGAEFVVFGGKIAHQT